MGLNLDQARFICWTLCFFGLVVRPHVYSVATRSDFGVRSLRARDATQTSPGIQTYRDTPFPARQTPRAHQIAAWASYHSWTVRTDVEDPPSFTTLSPPNQLVAHPRWAQQCEIEVAIPAMILFRNGFAPTLELALFCRQLDTSLTNNCHPENRKPKHRRSRNLYFVVPSAGVRLAGLAVKALWMTEGHLRLFSPSRSDNWLTLLSGVYEVFVALETECIPGDVCAWTALYKWCSSGTIFHSLLKLYLWGVNSPKHCVWAGSDAFLQVCRVEGSMDFSCSLDGSHESVKCQVVGEIVRSPVWEQTHSYIYFTRVFPTDLWSSYGSP